MSTLLDRLLNLDTPSSVTVLWYRNDLNTIAPWGSVPSSPIMPPVEVSELVQQARTAVVKCLAGNLCKHHKFGKIGKNRRVHKCAVYELLNLYRALTDPCVTDEKADAILCYIRGYCHCSGDCGCSEPKQPDPPPTPKLLEVPGGSGSGSGSGSGKPPSPGTGEPDDGGTTQKVK